MQHARPCRSLFTVLSRTAAPCHTLPTSALHTSALHPSTLEQCAKRLFPYTCHVGTEALSRGFSTTSQASTQEEAEQATTEASTDGSAAPHTYQQLYPWQSGTALLETLLEEPLLETEELLVLQKPYGLAQSLVPGGRQYGAAPPTHLSLDSALPELRRRYGKGLELFSAPEKWNSGVMVFAKTALVLKRLRKGGTGGRVMCTRGFLALVRHPPPKSTQLPVKRATQQDPKSGLGPQLVLKPGKNQMKLQRMDGFTVEHSVVKRGGVGGCAVMEVSVSSTRHNSVRCYLAHVLSPPLGDHLFSPRIAYVLGQPYLLPRTQLANSRAPPYPYEVQAALGLHTHTAPLLPLMLHHHRRTLPGYFSRLEAKERLRPRAAAFTEGKWASREGDDLVLRCPPPPHWAWTLGRLGLGDE